MQTAQSKNNFGGPCWMVTQRLPQAAPSLNQYAEAVLDATASSAKPIMERPLLIS